ncbi:MAG: ABC transporter permease [Actinobacteria bacterium]|nr:ABC transporter permease [Actinomycetota bacterium]
MSATEHAVMGPGVSRSPLERLSRGDLALLLGAVVVFGVLVYGAVSTQGFLSYGNFKAILASMGIIGIVAVGMSCITISGNLVSVTLGTTVVVTTMLFLAALTFGPVAAIVLTILAGAAVCALQGFLIGGFRANPIIVTIAFGTLQLGLAQRLTNQSTVYPPHDASFRFLAGTVFGLPLSIFVLIAITLALEFWLRRSRLGRESYLVGENLRAARASALRVTPVAVAAFALAGACAAVAGVLLGASQGNATLLTSETYTFQAIAAVLVGGIAITGGKGAIYRTVLGALFIAVVSDMLLLRGYSTGVQVLVRGLVVLAAVVIVQLLAKERA